MMAQVNLQLDTKDWDRLIRRVRDRAPVAVARAVNKSATSARTALVRAVAKDVGLTQKTIRPQIVLGAARPGRNPAATLRVPTKRIPLIKFGAKQFSYGVRARLKGGAQKYPGAFVATMRSGHTGVFRRRGKPRLPIAELHGPSLGRVFRNNWNVGVERFREQLPKNLEREFRFASRGR